MRYLSVCSGIEAASVAWEPLGWQPAAFSEIEKFPRAVLTHHFPDVPLHGDFTTIQGNEYGAVDLLVGGTPCQSFSVAGLRGGLGDDRGNLALEFARLAQRVRPRWILWENVPGVLSSNGGRDFGSILGAMGELGYGWAYRVLDAQHFGVPQRRRRVFLVGCLGDWRRAAAVLFERHCLQGNPAPRREARKGDSGPAENSTPSGEMIAQPYGVANCLTRRMHKGMNSTLNEGQTPVLTSVPVAIEDPVPPLMARSSRGGSQTLSPGYQTDGHMIGVSHTVRRLTPIECERLQGFPDNWTRISWRGRPLEECADGPRYKALGNSMAVPVMRWIGQRITAVEAIS